jgi:hypothetical protein
MTKLVKYLIYSTIGIAVGFFLFYQFDNRLFLFEARMLWAPAPFDAQLFQSGSVSERASMSVSIIKSERFVGHKCNAVREELGKATGDYYNSDSNITYRLTDKGSADWILTFVCAENGTIERVFIRKSCCSTSQKILYWTLERAFDR